MDICILEETLCEVMSTNVVTQKFNWIYMPNPKNKQNIIIWQVLWSTQVSFSFKVGIERMHILNVDLFRFVL